MKQTNEDEIRPGKKRDDCGPSVNMTAAIHAYRLAVVEKEIQAYQAEADTIAAKNAILQQENDRLKSEQKVRAWNLTIFSCGHATV